jgi:hypothetical protein
VKASKLKKRRKSKEEDSQIIVRSKVLFSTVRQESAHSLSSGTQIKSSVSRYFTQCMPSQSKVCGITPVRRLHLLGNPCVISLSIVVTHHTSTCHITPLLITSPLYLYLAVSYEVLTNGASSDPAILSCCRVHSYSP